MFLKNWASFLVNMCCYRSKLGDNVNSIIIVWGSVTRGSIYRGLVSRSCVYRGSVSRSCVYSGSVSRSCVSTLSRNLVIWICLHGESDFQIIQSIDAVSRTKRNIEIIFRIGIFLDGRLIQRYPCDQWFPPAGALGLRTTQGRESGKKYIYIYMCVCFYKYVCI